MTVKHNVLIVDDHRITQSGLRFPFGGLDRYAVVGALDRGATVNAFVQSQPVDLVILDLNLPDVRWINVLAEIVGSRDMTGGPAFGIVGTAIPKNSAEVEAGFEFTTGLIHLGLLILPATANANANGKE